MTEPFLVIGAPVHERAWVLPDWLHHLSIQDLPWERVVLLLNYGHSNDGTLEVLRQAEQMLPWTVEVLHDAGDDHVAERRWNYPRYEVMARLRNGLLERVRELKPSFYLSLDTDILLPKNGIADLLNDFDGAKFDAVSPLLYMTPTSKGYPNAMDLTSGVRPKLMHDFTMRVDVCFAAVMMRPSLYLNVDYRAHSRGEDIGWGENARDAGMVMGLNPRVQCKHVMNREMLTAPDERIGW